MNIHESISLKEAFQSIVPESMEVVRGVVLNDNPLKIQLTNDEKMTLNSNLIILPRHLSDYTAKCDIELDGGTISSETSSAGEHTHGLNGEHEGHEDGDGSHEHLGAGGHSHGLRSFKLIGASMKIYNALQTGERVFLLSFNKGKKYYVLDREVEM